MIHYILIVTGLFVGVSSFILFTKRATSVPYISIGELFGWVATITAGFSGALLSWIHLSDGGWGT